ncbi:C2H2 finger domain transcription factor mtfA [Mycena venus]|uniref:C2H2 finger domain transcription factor mtfA n=1 Tax=Mycena venus TaxID=2733690 RepID=A0A8H6YLL9_9AGAR|nr:C2H2 finger domain transcription factor mtfA [Mycena venus]
MTLRAIPQMWALHSQDLRTPFLLCPPAQPSPIPAAEKNFLESSLNNSILGNNSFPKQQDRYLPAEVVCGNTSVGHNNFIPICKAPPIGLLGAPSESRTSGSPSIGSPSPLPCLPPINSAAEHSKHTERHLTKPRKSYDCLVCHESFTRPSDLRTHENMHTGKQPFACNFQGCPKKFGSRFH